MNPWQTTWNTYENDSQRLNILFEMVSNASKLEKTLIVIETAIFISSLFYHFILHFNNPASVDSLILLAVAVGSEIFLLHSLDKVKTSYMNGSLLDEDASRLPPEDVNQRRIRYLKFKTELRKNNISKKMLCEIKEALTAKEDLQRESDNYLKRYFGFAAGLIIGLLIKVGGTFSTYEIILTIISISIFSFFVYYLMNIFPSSMGRLKELNYFLVLYSHETE